MNLDRILSTITESGVADDPDGNAVNSASQNSPLQGITSGVSNIASQLPGGMAGGLAAGGVMALLLGSKSTRKMAKKVAKVGGTAVLGGLAYKAYGNWQKNRSLRQTQPVLDHDIDLASQTIPSQLETSNGPGLEITLLKAMIAAAKSDGDFDKDEQRKLFASVEAMSLNVNQKAEIFEIMSRDITFDEIVAGVILDEHKAEVYLAAYLAIEVDDQMERAFLNNLATALNLPKGFSAYLEQQADVGVEN
ncbi:MAG: tellurite resistance TerB family protein [Arenicella sp.]|nr:tellurite resistance TerB family protein [Arenicella sp.]